MDSTTQAILISLFIVSVIAAGLYFSYEQGYLDPVIEKIGVYMFKAKAAAEKKKLQAQGMKAGEDFLDCESCTIDDGNFGPIIILLTL